MKRHILIFLPFIALIGISSCHKEEMVTWASADTIYSHTEFSDSIFFKWISDIEMSDDNWVLLDKGVGQAHILDEKFQYLRSIGKSGPGPEELKGATNIEVTNNKFYIYDYTGNKLNIYDRNGQFLATHKTQAFLSEFTVESNKLYSCSNEQVQAPLEIFDLKSGEVIKQFGQEASQALNYPEQHTAKLEDKIVAIYSFNSPLIDVYSSEGEFLKRTDLSSHPVFKPWLDEVDIKNLLKSNTPTQTVSMTMFWDCYISGGYLYLMPPTMNVKGKGKTNFLIQLELAEDSSMKIKRFIELKLGESSSFNCFAVSRDGKKVVGYDPGNGTITELLIN
jgi:hypothetical protein